MNKAIIIIMFIIISKILHSQEVRLSEEEKFARFIVNFYEKVYSDIEISYDYALKGARGIHTQNERDKMLNEIHKNIKVINNTIEKIKYNNKSIFFKTNPYLSGKVKKYTIRDPRLIDDKNVFLLIKKINRSDPYSMNEIKLLVDYFLKNLEDTIAGMRQVYSE